MKADEQLRRWVAGELDGVGEAGHLDNGDCCPDFACCRPENAANSFDRQRFVDGDERTRWDMIGGFLASMLMRKFGPGSVVTSREALEEGRDREGEEWKG